MKELTNFYINGKWVAPIGGKIVEVINPATEQAVARVAMGSPADVDAAVAAARAALPAYAATSREERVALLERIVTVLEARSEELAEGVQQELGAPQWLAQQAQAWMPVEHARVGAAALRTFDLERMLGNTMVRMAPAGVCGLITPWNWPAATIMCKVVPALAMGCTIVLKPSEFSPISTQVLIEALHEAGVPPGVLNMIYGDGAVVGPAISTHPGIDLVSITGSTRAGIDVAIKAAPTVKRVHQELGGKSANILLPGANIPAAVEAGIKSIMFNAGQSCSAPSRMLVPASRLDEVKDAVRRVMPDVQPGPAGSNAFMGPVVNKAQFERIQALIATGIAEGATLVAGGVGKPEGLETGYFVKPTVFADTTPDMTVVKEEIFGPVLAIQTYEDVEDAIRLANDSIYGLAAYVQGDDIAELRAVGARLEAGQVYLNGSGLDLIDMAAPFGGFKQSGNGREWGPYAFEGFAEIQSLIGYTPR